MREAGASTEIDYTVLGSLIRRSDIHNHDAVVAIVLIA